MLTVVLLGFIFALSLVFIGKWIKGRLAVLSTLVPLGLFLYFLGQIPAVSSQGAVRVIYEWVPSMGVSLSFHLDGLALLFCLLITGIGTLVFFYTSNYLKGDPYLDRFYGYLGMFMGSMLGLVLSDNIISLFIFWELTSITSFFLIGYKNEDPASQKSALTALGITGLGGMSLLAGMLLIASVSGSMSLQEIFTHENILHNHALYPLILFFVLGGAFTKSAQFPFHFWLPGAMKAPTPVSTYLHSATMVKAGVYLLLRMTPALGNHVFWNTTLMIFGGITMCYAAYHTIFRKDLKGILAYSTISALGIMVFLTGLGIREALLAAVVFILVHALYKAALFLITGIIDHETGTRDVSVLSGLQKVMLPVAIAGFLAAFSNAGIPPMFGFVGKDLIYEATLGLGSNAMLLTGLALFTNVLLLVAGFMAGIKPFTGKLPEAFQDVHAPGFVLWGPPLLLGLCSVLFGLFPGLLDHVLVLPALLALGAETAGVHLKLWHGFNLVLGLSMATLAAGFILYRLVKPSEYLEQWLARFMAVSPETIILWLAKGFEAFSAKWTSLWQNGYLRFYVSVIIVFIVALIGFNLLANVTIYIDVQKLSELTIYEVSLLLIMYIAVYFTVFSPSRLAAVASMGVVGFAMCLIFMFYSAPDLAMTQFAIDTLTVILFVLVLYRLPKYLKLSDNKSRTRDAVLAVAFGLVICVLTLEVLNEPINRETSQYYAENAYVLAKGKNVVNVILVDFRGIDTMVEIMVLVVAALGVFSLLKLRLRKSEMD
jgi:multicomponent Na+:H+ antiporter subunit A